MAIHKIKFTHYHERPATQEDVDIQDAWLKAHPGTQCVPTVLGELIDAEDEEELPARWDICNRCDGEGTHTNPNIDGNGITAEEWERDWDEESREMYMSGGYDVACEAGCRDGKVLVPDEERCTNEPLKSLLEAYEEQLDERAASDREDRQIRYMESGGREGSRY